MSVKNIWVEFLPRRSKNILTNVGTLQVFSATEALFIEVL